MLPEKEPDDMRFGRFSNQELAVIDRAGRLQIPQEYLKAMGIVGKGMLRVEFENGHIVLCPPEEVIT